MTEIKLTDAQQAFLDAVLKYFKDNPTHMPVGAILVEESSHNIISYFNTEFDAEEVRELLEAAKTGLKSVRRLTYGPTVGHGGVPAVLAFGPLPKNPNTTSTPEKRPKRGRWPSLSHSRWCSPYPKA